MSVLQATNVVKKYGSATALDGFSINMNKGEIIALLGPNGAGKTTFVKSLLGLLKISSGEIKLFGADAGDVNAKKRLSYLPEKFTFYSYYTVEGALKFYAQMYGVEASLEHSAIESSLQKTGVLDLKQKKISSLSKGQLQRVGIACAIVGDHEFMIFDEPFSGLDPIGIKEVKDLCLELKHQGKTILINSHILSEMEKIADSVIILNKGKILESGTVAKVSGDEGLEEKFYKLIKGAPQDA